MERRPLEMDLPEELLLLAERFRAGGHQLYVVGGAVRDAVLGVKPKDFDVATSATPDQVKELLKPYRYSLLEVGEAFGVVVVVLPHPLEKLEIATFREDMSAGRHPVVRFATIVEDVQRRDLTINALFYDIQAREVVDLVGGLEDLKLGIVKTVGDARQRFAEDRLRVLRVIRFAARFGWPIAEHTERAILDDNNLNGVSAERIRDEFVRGLSSAADPARFFDLFEAFKLWSQVFPGIACDGMDMPATRNLPVALAILLEENDVGFLAKKLNALKYSADEIAQITFLLRLRTLTVESAYRMRKAYATSKLSDEDVREFIGLVHHPRRSALVEALLEYRPTVSGDDLLAEGYSGRALGMELERRELELFRRHVVT